MKKTDPSKNILKDIKDTFECFIRIAEVSKNRHTTLKARSLSVKLRTLLKSYRIKTLEEDKKINEIMRKAREEEEKIRNG